MASALTYIKARLDDSDSRLLKKIATAVFVSGFDPVAIPRPDDTEQRLLWKIVFSLHASSGDPAFEPRMDDLAHRLVWKWCSLLFVSGSNPKFQPRLDDMHQRLLWKIASLLYAPSMDALFRPYAEDAKHRLLWKIASMLQIPTPAPPVPPEPTCDADALAFIAAAGIVDPVVIAALCDFVPALKLDGTWGKLDVIYPFVGPDAAGNAVNLKSPGTFDVSWSGTFTTNDETGVKGSVAGAAYGDTGWAVTSQNAGIVFLYASEVGLVGRYAAMTREGDNATGLYQASPSAVRAWFNTDIGGYTFASASAIPLSVAAKRRDAAQHIIVFDGAPELPAAAASVSVSSYPLYLFCRNWNGAPSSHWDGKMQGFAAGNADVSPAQSVTLHNAFAALNLALSR